MLNIQQTLATLTRHVAERAIASGYSVLPTQERCLHLIGIRLPDGFPTGLASAFEQARVFVSLRGDAIRVAPHVYNDRQAIDRLFEVLYRLLRGEAVPDITKVD